MPHISFDRERAQARSFVQLAFGGIAAFSISMSACFHLGFLGDGLPSDDISAVTSAFLILAAVNTAMMFVWEGLFPLSE